MSASQPSNTAKTKRESTWSRQLYLQHVAVVEENLCLRAPSASVSIHHRPRKHRSRRSSSCSPRQVRSVSGRIATQASIRIGQHRLDSIHQPRHHVSIHQPPKPRSASNNVAHELASLGRQQSWAKRSQTCPQAVSGALGSWADA
eukprot:2196529-Rhodomonas_salina.1